jgi:RHS repeat-associated protein
MDNLTYAYAAGTNRLRHISDGVPPYYFSTDIDGQQTDNYAYDANGSMQKDLQRDVAFVVNDIRNLPVSMWKVSTGQELKYYYDTEGKRIRKDAGSTEYYVNGVSGETEAIVKSDESGATHSILGVDNLGQVKRTGSTFARYYYLKDHLGTIKMTVDAACNTTGYDDYYPFGMQMDGRCYSSSADPRYKYTAKERDSESGYDWFEVRSYDARIGMFRGPDPLASSFPGRSPYVYAGSNPVRFFDPTGMADSASAAQATELASEYERWSRMPVFGPLYSMIAGYMYSEAGDQARSMQNLREGAIGTVGTIGAMAALTAAEGATTKVGTGREVDPVRTPYTIARQANTPEALAAREAVASGASLYRTGEFGVQEIPGQAWSFSNPLSTADYSFKMGMPPTARFDWVMEGAMKPGGHFVTRNAPGIGANLGGHMEVIAVPDAVRINWFHLVGGNK